MKKPLAIMFAAVLATCTLAGSSLVHAAGTTRYVDIGKAACSDSGTGTATKPYCQIAAAALDAQPGDTVMVMSGTYSGNIVPANSGTSTDPIVYQEASGENAIVSGGTNGFKLTSESYITIKNFTVKNTSGEGILLTSSSHITLSGNSVTSAGTPGSSTTLAYGIKLDNTVHSTLSSNKTYSNSNAGIYLTNGADTNTLNKNISHDNSSGTSTRYAQGIFVNGCSGNTLKNNKTYNNEDSGIGFTGGSGNYVINNITYGNGDHGIDDLNTPNQIIINNTVYNNTQSAGINVEGTSSGATIENNISENNGGVRTNGDIRVDTTSESGTTVDYNIVFNTSDYSKTFLYTWGTTAYSSRGTFQNASGQGANDLNANPLWTSPSTADFSLQAGSPAIDSADASVAHWSSTDSAGKARYDDPATPNTGAGTPKYSDRGALEYQG